MPSCRRNFRIGSRGGRVEDYPSSSKIFIKHFDLYEFIDWLLALPEALEDAFLDEIHDLEERRISFAPTSSPVMASGRCS